MDEDTFSEKPNLESWSATEIVEHLITVGRRVTALLDKALAKSDGTDPALTREHDDQFVVDAVSSRAL